MKRLTMKEAFKLIVNKDKPMRRPVDTSLPSHLKKYPNMKFGRREIINTYLKPVEKKLNFDDASALPKKLKFKKLRTTTRLKEIMPPQHDFINFKNMSGNEILYNMTNYEHFSQTELVNSLYEFSKRVNLPENQKAEDLRNRKWVKHSYVSPLYKHIVLKLPRMNAFDNLKLNDQVATWKRVELCIDRLLHKLTASNIISLLELLNVDSRRTSKDFLNKLLTIIPIHVEHLKDDQLLTLIRVCIDQNMINQRLFSYFIYPDIEKRIKRFNLSKYTRVLNLLCDLHYQEDSEFWNEHILPCVFNFEMNDKQVRNLWEAMLKVKIECPNVDVSKHLLLIENVIKQFDNLKESGQDIEDVLLMLEKDMNLIPVQKKTFTAKEAKEAAKRLKDRATLKQFMEKFNSQDDSATRAQETQLNLSKLLEIKDWKKAKYEINLAEAEKIKQARAEQEVEVVETIPQVKTDEDKDNKEEKTEEKVLEAAKSEVEKEEEEEFNPLNSKYMQKKARKMRKTKDQGDASK